MEAVSRPFGFSVLASVQDDCLNVCPQLRGPPVQTLRVLIQGLGKADETQTQLEAQVGDQMKTFVVASKHLAETIGVTLHGEFEKKILENIPLEAEVEIQGRKMNKIIKYKRLSS